MTFKVDGSKLNMITGDIPEGYEVDPGFVAIRKIVPKTKRVLMIEIDWPEGTDSLIEYVVVRRNNEFFHARINRTTSEDRPL